LQAFNLNSVSTGDFQEENDYVPQKFNVFWKFLVKLVAQRLFVGYTSLLGEGFPFYGSAVCAAVLQPAAYRLRFCRMAVFVGFLQNAW